MKSGSRRGCELNLRLVASLVVVVEEGHFGRAADRLFVTAPALSQQIRRLEEQVGASLLDRSVHPVTLTEAGELFLPQARECLDSADRAMNVLDALDRRRSRRLRIGFINGAAGSLGREVLDSLHSEVELVQLDWTQQVSAVAGAMVDASFVRPPLPHLDGLVLERIGTEPRVAALPRGHRLADRDVISIDELDGEIQVASDSAPAEWVKWWSVDPRPSGVPVTYGRSVRTMDEQLEVVANGRAVAITAATIAEYYTRSDIRFVTITDIEPSSIELCTRQGDLSPAVRELRNAVAVVARRWNRRSLLGRAS
ncbi:DNA-binding transcriptional LysR family regulator [Rhodococcus sp. 27YEA15]|uniref:LysR family transcriptional regulator n=1 Tax=Rhodococcus sp. 27YEA15 TaxID=3156259 RepID=UPI003C7A6324